MIIKCNNGWEFDPETETFKIGKFVRELTVQDVADMVSLAHAEKVQKDNIIKEKYKNKEN